MIESGKRLERSEAVERLKLLERTDPHDERPHLGRSGTRAALELLKPMEPYISDNTLNGAQRLNGLNVLNGLQYSLQKFSHSYFESSTCLTRFTMAGSISYKPFTIFSMPGPSTGSISSFALSASTRN